MKNYGISILILFIFFSVSCKKHVHSVSICTTKLYGYTGTFDFTGLFSSQTFGIIDPATVTNTNITTFMSSIYANQGAYDPAGYYYVFKYYNSGSTQILYKINLGTNIATPLSYAGGGPSDFEGLVFNRFNNTLYCFTIGSPCSISAITFPSLTTYAIGLPIATVGTATSLSPISSTVDNATGTIYYELMDYTGTPSYSIEKYLPGSITPTSIASGTDKHIIGLRFNKNDNMLYAIQQDNISTTSAPFDFIKISPSGLITVIATLPFAVNDEFYSAGIDPCTNLYLLSRIDVLSANTGLFYELNFSNGSFPTPIQTTGLYQGMEETN